MLLILPIVGTLVSRVDPRIMIAFGFLLSGVALTELSHINLGIDFRTAMWWRIHQAGSLAFLFVPINTISYTGVPKEENNQVSAMVNLMRNVGSSVGISVFSTMLARREQVHQTFLSSHVAHGSPPYEHYLGAVTQRLTAAGTGAHAAGQQALGLVYQSVQQQSAVLAYIDVIRIFIIASFVGAAAVLLLKRKPPGQAPAGH